MSRGWRVELSPAADACADCGGKLRRIGEDVTEELEYVPGRFVVNLIHEQVAPGVPSEVAGRRRRPDSKASARHPAIGPGVARVGLHWG